MTVGASELEVCSAGQQAQIETDVTVLRQNFFFFWETSVFALKAFQLIT